LNAAADDPISRTHACDTRTVHPFGLLLSHTPEQGMTPTKLLLAASVLLAAVSCAFAASRNRATEPYYGTYTPAPAQNPPYIRQPQPPRFRSTTPNDTTRSIEYEMDMGAGAGR
jgi:hypothetical protein